MKIKLKFSENFDFPKKVVKNWNSIKNKSNQFIKGKAKVSDINFKRILQHPNLIDIQIFPLVKFLYEKYGIEIGSSCSGHKHETPLIFLKIPPRLGYFFHSAFFDYYKNSITKKQTTKVTNIKHIRKDIYYLKERIMLRMPSVKDWRYWRRLPIFGVFIKVLKNERRDLISIQQRKINLDLLAFFVLNLLDKSLEYQKQNKYTRKIRM